MFLISSIILPSTCDLLWNLGHWLSQICRLALASRSIWSYWSNVKVHLKGFPIAIPSDEWGLCQCSLSLVFVELSDFKLLWKILENVFYPHWMTLIGPYTYYLFLPCTLRWCPQFRPVLHVSIWKMISIMRMQFYNLFDTFPWIHRPHGVLRSIQYFSFCELLTHFGT